MIKNFNRPIIVDVKQYFFYIINTFIQLNILWSSIESKGYPNTILKGILKVIGTHKVWIPHLTISALQKKNETVDRKKWNGKFVIKLFSARYKSAFSVVLPKTNL